MCESSHAPERPTPATEAWNLGVRVTRDPATFEKLVRSFDDLWLRGVELTAAWVDEYAKVARMEARRLPAGEDEPEKFEPLPAPRDVQIEALAALPTQYRL